MADWYPISPRLTKEGAFEAFADLPNGKDMKPVPLAPNQRQFADFKVHFTSVKMETASRLGIASMVSLTSSANTLMMTYDAMRYTETSAEAPVGGAIYGTRWGAGFRVMITLWDLQAKLDAQPGIIASGVELGLVNASFEIIGFGFSNGDIFKDLPGPGRFDRNNYNRIAKAADTINGYLQKSADTLKPQPLQVFMSPPRVQSPLASSQAALFAARQIKAGKTCTAALLVNKVKSRFNEDAIRAVYKQLLSNDAETALPSSEDKDRASDWLKFEQVGG
jgi:hypothetical protein